MKIELRADGAHISGYVNVTEKKSRPVITPHGKVVEEVEPGAFRRAIDRAGDVTVTVDHDSTHIYASTKEGTLFLREDDIGLHAETVITDPDVIALAKQGKIRGWSFGMFNVKDSLEERADGYPLRRVKDLDLDHITLVVKKLPAYSATSVEIRADTQVDVETRSRNIEPQITELCPRWEQAPSFDISAYQKRLAAIKK